MGRKMEKAAVMVIEAIRNLRSQKGFSARDILNYIGDKQQLTDKKVRCVLTALKRGIDYGIIRADKGKFALKVAATRPALVKVESDNTGEKDCGCGKRRGRKGRSRSRSRGRSGKRRKSLCKPRGSSRRRKARSVRRRRSRRRSGKKRKSSKRGGSKRRRRVRRVSMRKRKICRSSKRGRRGRRSSRRRRRSRRSRSRSGRRRRAKCRC